MDIATLLGLIVGIGSVLAAFLMEGGHISALIQVPAMILVVFGTFGAATVTTSVKQLINLPNLMKVAFSEKKMDSRQLIDLLFDLSQKARKNGLLSLEKDIDTIKEPFLRKAIQLAIDVRNEQDTGDPRDRDGVHRGAPQGRAAFFQKLGGFSPTWASSVLGLIHALGSMESSSNMASAIASAFIATLWGVALANLVYLPLSDKLKHKHQDEALYLEIITEGAISLAMGDNPRVIRMKLVSFLLPDKRMEDKR